MTGPIEDGLRKGRGALSNPAGRFETKHRQAFDDGWPADEELPSIETTVTAEPARSIISRNDSPDLGFTQSINPYAGCETGCIYCFARPSHAYRNLSPGLDFETRLFYKPNAAELLDQELRKPGYECRSITLGANTDPYQPIEKKLGITRSLLEVGLKFRQPMFIVTKGAAVLARDIELLAEMAKSRLVGVAVSITSLSDDIKRTLEPRAASPAARLKLVRWLSEAGVPVMVMVAPVIPFVTDHEMERILEASRDAGALAAGYVMLRLPWEVKDLFEQWLRAHFPQKADHVMSLMRQLHGGDPAHRAAEPAPVEAEDESHEGVPDVPARQPGQFKRNEYYSAEFSVRQRGQGPLAQMFEQRFRLATRRLGLTRSRQLTLDTSQFRLPPVAGDQLGMDF